MVNPIFWQQFLDVIAPLVSVERQMQNLIACMSVLFSTATLSTEDMEEFQTQYGDGFKAKDVRSDAKKVKSWLRGIITH